MPVSLDRMRYELEKLTDLGEIVVEDGDVYLSSIFRAESKCADAVRRVLDAPANQTVPSVWIKGDYGY